MPASFQASAFDYTPLTGSLLRRTVYTSGSGTWVRGLNTTMINLTMVGPGGATGGGPGASVYGEAAAGGGGLIKLLSVTGSNIATYNVGTVGTDNANTGAVAATFLYGGVTYTAGVGGPGANTNDNNIVDGGTATNGDINISLAGNIVASAYSAGGGSNGRVGGNAPFGFGSGGRGTVVSVSPTGYGAGRGSAADSTNHSGVLGLIIIDEYA